MLKQQCLANPIRTGKLVLVPLSAVAAEGHLPCVACDESLSPGGVEHKISETLCSIGAQIAEHHALKSPLLSLIGEPRSAHE